jgi:hypothetical protein
VQKSSTEERCEARGHAASRVLVAKALMQMANSTMIEIDVGHDKSLMDRRAAPRRCLGFNGKDVQIRFA